MRFDIFPVVCARLMHNFIVIQLNFHHMDRFQFCVQHNAGRQQTTHKTAGGACFCCVYSKFLFVSFSCSSLAHSTIVSNANVPVSKLDFMQFISSHNLNRDFLALLYEQMNACMCFVYAGVALHLMESIMILLCTTIASNL